MKYKRRSLNAEAIKFNGKNEILVINLILMTNISQPRIKKTVDHFYEFLITIMDEFNQEYYIKKGCWVVRDYNNDLRIYVDGIFQNLYEAAE